MSAYLIEVPMPSMGATVNELTVVNLKTASGDRVAKGQKIAELESDKSIFEFESPCDGVVRAILAQPGDVRPSGSPFLQIETTDQSLRHLARKSEVGGQTKDDGGQKSAIRQLVWTPRAAKMMQEAGVDPASVTDIAGTGPGGRISGDDVTAWLARRQS